MLATAVFGVSIALFHAWLKYGQRIRARVLTYLNERAQAEVE